MEKHLKIVAIGGLFLFVAAASSADLAVNENHTTYLTFSHSVALPGVQLAPGTYIFESLPTSAGVVRVSSRDRSTVYLTAFTNTVDRPAGLPADRIVSLGEAPRGAAPPINVWFPADSDKGHQFRYNK